MLALLAILGFELGYHRDLSATASAGFSKDARRIIVNANLFVDVKSAVGLLLRRKSSPVYDQHFDDCFSLADHRQRWSETEHRIVGTHTLDSAAPSVMELARRLGSAHHSGQDYYAHSNHVEHLSMNGEVEPVTHSEIMTEARFTTIRTRWQTVGLMSGAYFEQPPDIGSVELHHRTLNKDKPLIRGEYIYDGRLDRSTMHDRALACASRESERLNSLAAEHHPEAFKALATYRSGLGERMLEIIKYWFARSAATISGHWR